MTTAHWVILVSTIGGLVSSFIACMRGRDPSTWMLYGAVLPLISLIMVLVLPRVPDK